MVRIGGGDLVDERAHLDLVPLRQRLVEARVVSREGDGQQRMSFVLLEQVVEVSPDGLDVQRRLLQELALGCALRHDGTDDRGNERPQHEADQLRADGDHRPSLGHAITRRNGREWPHGAHRRAAGRARRRRADPEGNFSSPPP